LARDEQHTGSADVGSLRPVTAKPVLTADELAEALRHAAPPTEDDMTILEDGRRIDSRAAAAAWLAELAKKRSGANGRT
jgi:hypothetical protein